MIVSELIKTLQRCPQDAIVMYEMNELNEDEEKHYGIEDVLVGSGTLEGFVFLAEEFEIRGEQ